MPGADLLHINVYHGYILQILLAEALFVHKLKRRESFTMRIVIGLPMFGLLAIVVPNFIARYVSGWFSLTIFLLSLVLWVFCLKSSFKDILFRCVGAQLVQNLSYNIENLIYQPFSDFFTGPRWFVLSVSVTIVVYLVCYLVLKNRLDERQDINMNSVAVYLMSIISATFVYVMHFLFQQYGIDRIWVTRPPLILCCIFGLCVQFGLLALQNERDQKQMLERLMENEQRQYEITKTSMDIINMKAHDLKHQIARIRAMGKIDGEELAEIEEAVSQYEMNLHTGNRTLDVILAEKQLLCRKHEINLTAIADGKAISFMKPGDIASLFGNALDNAIECEQKIDNEGERCIALNVFRKGNLVCVRVENYCPMQQQMHEGLPVTTKRDRIYHGFGLMSIRYITRKYGGTLHISTENNLFVLTILLPLAE